MPRTAPFLPAPSPGTSTSYTKATFIQAHRDRHKERNLHHPQLRARFQRQHPLPHFAHRHRLRWPHLDPVCDHPPRKVNLTFDTVPTGRTLHLDGIAKATPFVYDTLTGFSHTIEARDQTVGSITYTFQSWSDGGAQQHSITAPDTDQTYTATYSQSTTPVSPAFVQVNASTLSEHRAASLRPTTRPNRPGTSTWSPLAGTRLSATSSP